jgi:hypothetical protein
MELAGRGNPSNEGESLLILSRKSICTPYFPLSANNLLAYEGNILCKNYEGLLRCDHYHSSVLKGAGNALDGPPYSPVILGHERAKDPTNELAVEAKDATSNVKSQKYRSGVMLLL